MFVRTVILHSMYMIVFRNRCLIIIICLFREASSALMFFPQRTVQLSVPLQLLGWIVANVDKCPTKGCE